MLDQDEKLKIAIGVWICFSDGKADISESTQLYQMISQDLLPESKVEVMFCLLGNKKVASTFNF